MTTHSWEERWETLQLVRELGMEVCCGGIIGMGESLEQRAELAAQFAALDPDEVPLNFLDPRPGTPFATLEPVPALDALRTIAAFRLALPRTILRFAGGRELTLGDLGARQGMVGGINAVIVGNYLTTLGRDPQEDLDLLAELSMPRQRAEQDPVTRSPGPMIAPELHRSLREIASAQGPKVVLDGREVQLLCSNDYLGLAGDPRLREAAAEAAYRWGAGAAASPLVSGRMTIHRELEERLAELKGYAACVLFGSGYLANTGVVAALATDGVVASDELNHASIVDGCRLARARTLVYPHREIPRGADVIVTDGVFSMDGDLAPLEALVETGARVIVDEAHATGVIGPEGRGLVHELGLQDHVITIGTLGKALGSYGAFVCCDRRTADYLVNRARTLIYSTALPPPSIGAALKALDLMDRERVARLHANARVLRDALGVKPSTMPIVPLIIGDPEEAMGVCEAWLEQGFFAQAIRPPTVPEGTSRLRVVATAAHDPSDLRAAGRAFNSAS